jgi:FMN phosphatase YigB (HAD superfamily)
MSEESLEVWEELKRFFKTEDPEEIRKGLSSADEGYGYAWSRRTDEAGNSEIIIDEWRYLIEITKYDAHLHPEFEGCYPIYPDFVDEISELTKFAS